MKTLRSRHGRWSALVAVVALGCGAARPVVAPAAGVGRLRVAVTLGRDVTLTRRASGRLAIAWLTPDEARARAAGQLDLRATIDALARFCVAGDVDLERGGPGVCTFQLPPGTYVPIAVLDGRGEFLETWLGGGGDGNLLGKAEAPVVVRADVTTDAAVALREVVHADTGPAPERCAGPRTTLLRVRTRALAGSVGNAVNRRLCVHLPADYEVAPTRRYPVLWLLPGLGGTDTSGFAGSVVAARDAVATALGRDAILVAVDTSTRLGSTYLVDSPVSGAWATFLARDAVAAVDAGFRTIPDASARALLGQSTGGFNAVSYGLRNPTTFSVIAASAPDALDFAGWFLDDAGRGARPRWLGWMRLEDAMRGVGQWTSYAADWSPDPTSPHGLSWPVDLATGALRPAVWARWLAQSPTVLLDDPVVAAASRAHLAGRIYLTVGRRDEADLYAPTERFSARLRALGIAHTFAPTDEGHFATPTRVRAMLEFALQTLRPAS